MRVFLLMLMLVLMCLAFSDSISDICCFQTSGADTVQRYVHVHWHCWWVFFPKALASDYSTKNYKLRFKTSGVVGNSCETGGMNSMLKQTILHLYGFSALHFFSAEIGLRRWSREIVTDIINVDRNSVAKSIRKILIYTIGTMIMAFFSFKWGPIERHEEQSDFNVDYLEHRECWHC